MTTPRDEQNKTLAEMKRRRKQEKNIPSEITPTGIDKGKSFKTPWLLSRPKRKLSQYNWKLTQKAKFRAWQRNEGKS